MARILRTGFARLQGLVRDTVTGSREGDDTGYEGPEVVVMLQSIASLQTSGGPR